ncbi:MAG TPA: YCF48-related protein [Steroidobacteraceae bacterium]|nr:YCF48-related protein [Steroidobacteraceae bacterium]
MLVRCSLRGFAAGLVALPLVATAQDEPSGPNDQYAEIAPLAAQSLLLDGVAIDGRLVAVGERGHILVSDDGGTSWTQARVPTRATLTGVWFDDRQHGWAVGHDEVILKSVDGGLTWERVHAAPENLWPLLDIWFEDARNGMAVGAYSRFLVTDDAGETWTDVPFDPAPVSALEAGADDAGAAAEDPVEDEWSDEEDLGFDVHLNEIVPSGTRLYLPAEAGQIFRSDDGGVTWQRLPSPYEGSFYGALPLGGDSLLIFGLRGNLFRSEDAGMSWTEVDSGTEAMLTDGILTDDGTVVLVGLAGTVIVSRDGGRSFALDQQADRKGFARILPANGGFVLLGEAGARRYELPPPVALTSGADR